MAIKTVTAVAIENKKGEILIVLQKKWNGFWTLPGGHMEEGEGIVGCALREGTEETGLQLKPLELYCFGEEVDPVNFDKKGHFIFFHLHCSTVTETLILQENEIQEAKWISLDELDAFPIAPGFKKSLEVLREYKGKKGKIIPQFLSLK